MVGNYVINRLNFNVPIESVLLLITFCLVQMKLQLANGKNIRVIKSPPAIKNKVFYK